MEPIILSRPFADCRKHVPKRAMDTKMKTRQFGFAIVWENWQILIFSLTGEKEGVHTRGAYIFAFVNVDNLWIANSRMEYVEFDHVSIIWILLIKIVFCVSSCVKKENDTFYLWTATPKTDAFKEADSISGCYKITCLSSGMRSWRS